MLYRRRELWLLLILTVCLAAGLAIREFRRGFPDLAERLENLDADAPTVRPAPRPPATFPPRPPKIDRSLDLNRATADDLRRLPGIGPTLADQIIRTRERRGRFAAPDDLRAVPGMGPKKFERIRDLVTVGQQ